MQPSYFGPSLGRTSPKRRSAASSRRPSTAYDELNAKEFDAFVDETALKIKRALHLVPPEPPESSRDVFQADDSKQKAIAPVYPSLPSPPPLADDSIGDASILAARGSQVDHIALPPAHDQERDQVSAALDTSAEEEESELESESEPEFNLPKEMPKSHKTTIMQPLFSGERDPLRRLKHTLDTGTIDVLYGQDSESEPSDAEPELDEDEQDDQERWTRIPAALKAKSRAKEESDEEEWMQSSDHEEEDGPDTAEDAPSPSASASDSASSPPPAVPEVIQISDSEDEEGASVDSPPVAQKSHSDEEDELDYEHESFVNGSQERNGSEQNDEPGRQDSPLYEPQADSDDIAFQPPSPTPKYDDDDVIYLQSDEPQDDPFLASSPLLRNTGTPLQVQHSSYSEEDIPLRPPSRQSSQTSERPWTIEDIIAAGDQLDQDEPILPAFEDFYAPAGLAEYALDNASIGNLSEGGHDNDPPEFGVLKDKTPQKPKAAKQDTSSSPSPQPPLPTRPNEDVADENTDNTPSSVSPAPPDTHPERHVRIEETVEVLSIIQENDAPSPSYSVQTFHTRSERSTSPGNLSVHSYHSSTKGASPTRPDEVLSPRVHISSYYDEEPPLLGTDEDGILQVPEQLVSEPNLDDEVIRERLEEALPESDAHGLDGPETSPPGKETNGLLETAESIPSEPNATDANQQPDVEMEDATVAENVVVPSPRKPNILQAGEWTPDIPIQFGGESLEASVREALYDPERRDQVLQSLDKIEDSDLGGIGGVLLDAAIRAMEDTASREPDFADVGVSPVRERGHRVAFPEDEAELERSQEIPAATSLDIEELLQEDVIESGTSTDPVPYAVEEVAEPASTKILVAKDDEAPLVEAEDVRSVEDEQVLEAAYNRDPFDVLDPPLVSSTDQDAAQAGAVDLPPVSMSELSGGYALRDELLAKDLAENDAASPNGTSGPSTEDAGPSRLPLMSPIRTPSPIPVLKNDPQEAPALPTPKDASSPLSSPEAPEFPSANEEAPAEPLLGEEEATDAPAIFPSQTDDANPKDSSSEDDGSSDTESASDIEMHLKFPLPQKLRKPTRSPSLPLITSQDNEESFSSQTSRRRSSRLAAKAEHSPGLASTSQIQTSPLKENSESTIRLGDPSTEPPEPQPSPKAAKRKMASSPVPMSIEEGTPETPPSARALRIVNRDMARPKVHAHGGKHTILVPAPTSPHLNSPSGHLPVTRSHCTFRKISMPSSLPNRVYRVLVPECSLAGKQEEMDQDEVVDLGSATVEDHDAATSIASKPRILDDESEKALARIVGLELLDDVEVLPAVDLQPSDAAKKRKRSLEDEGEPPKRPSGFRGLLSGIFGYGRKS